MGGKGDETVLTGATTIKGLTVEQENVMRQRGLKRYEVSSPEIGIKNLLITFSS